MVETFNLDCKVIRCIDCGHTIHEAGDYPCYCDCHPKGEQN